MPFYCSFYSIPRSIGIDCLLLQQNKKHGYWTVSQDTFTAFSYQIGPLSLQITSHRFYQEVY